MADTKTHAPTDYRFSHALCNAYADKDTIFAAMRLGQVVKAAQQVRKDRLTALTDTANINVATLGSQQARDSLEHAYKVRCGRLPAGRMQGTDHYLGKQFKHAYQGHIGFFNTKEIVSFFGFDYKYESDTDDEEKYVNKANKKFHKMN